MQKPRPTDVTGVTVNLSVIDANGNSRPIGTATTTSSGTYSLTWTPDIPGDYQVTATFAGTNSYYPSSSQTTFTVMQAAPTASPYPITVVPSTEMYIIGTGIAIIAAIGIVGAVMLFAIKRRP